MSGDGGVAASAGATDWVARLVQIVARLCGPGGCPWDAQQTHESLKPYIVEETGELLEAIEEGDDDGMTDELGDVLLQVVLHAQIAAAEGRFDLQEVARRCCAKMIRRHPHVFADGAAVDAAAVVAQWDNIKKAEPRQAGHVSAVSGIPRHLPALQRAQKIQRRAARTGFDWPSVERVLGKIDEELAEVREALTQGDEAALSEEIGDLLFAVVNLSRFRERHAEELLHRTVRKFEQRFMCMEARLIAAGKRIDGCSIVELEAAWQHAKEELGRSSTGPARESRP